MKISIRILLLLGILALSFGISSAQSAQDQSPSAYLMDYINRINTGDYASAYTMMDNRNDTYEEFVAGYEHTVRIVPYFGFMGAAAGSTYVTSVLLGYQDDGTVETYYGYFQMHSGQLYEPIRNNGGWVLSRGDFRLISDTTVLPNSVLDTMLETAWDETLNVSGQLLSQAEVNSEQSLALFSYYDYINTGYYQNAWNLWLNPNYRLPYPNFVEGYRDTDYVMVYTGQSGVYPQTGVYYLPAVLVAENSDGSFETYSGCYAMGRFNTGALGIVNGSFTLLLDDAPTSDEIFDALANLNCPGIRMGL